VCNPGFRLYIFILFFKWNAFLFSTCNVLVPVPKSQSVTAAQQLAIITTPSIKPVSLQFALSEVHITGAAAGLYNFSFFQQLLLILTVLIHYTYPYNDLAFRKPLPEHTYLIHSTHRLCVIEEQCDLVSDHMLKCLLCCFWFLGSKCQTFSFGM
jgi:hypothetical protein